MSLSDELYAIYSGRGAATYFGETVTTMEHSLQTAHFAEIGGASETLVIEKDRASFRVKACRLSTVSRHPKFFSTLGFETVYRLIYQAGAESTQYRRTQIMISKGAAGNGGRGRDP